MKTCKTFFLVLFLSVLSIPAFSQFTFGPKAGVNFSNLHKTTEFGAGADAGLFFRVGKRLHFQPELTYSFRTTSFMSSFYPDASDVAVAHKIEMHSLNLPLLLGYKIVNNPNFKLRTVIGPRLGLFLDEVTQSGDVQIGGQAGIGIDAWRFTFDFRYDFSGTNYHRNLWMEYNMFNLDIGFKIFKD